MREPTTTEEVQRPSFGASLQRSLAGARPAALAGGDGAATADLSPTRQNVPIVAAPAVTDEQRQRLRRAIDAYRAEA